MSLNYLQTARSVDTQEVLPFRGEGAYHGSTKRREDKPQEQKPRAPQPVVDEMRPTTLDGKYAEREGDAIDTFEAHFPNRCETVATLPVPTQQEIRDDGVTFCWCPFDLALDKAGPLTRSVLEAMQPHLVGDKAHTYVDAKIQFFAAGDVPVDSQHWHVDGSIAVRDERVQRLGHSILHDMRARQEHPEHSPRYLSYQSSTHCATRFVTEPVTLELPELVPDFDELDDKVRALDPAEGPQQAAAIVAFDGLSLHRADAASGDGWRLWIRVVETDREVTLNRDIIRCYGTVFRTTA